MAQLSLRAAARAILVALAIVSTSTSAQSFSFGSGITRITANVGSAAVSGCTPATINPGAIALIRPHMTIETVKATLGCIPCESYFVEYVGVTRYLFAVPLLNGGVYVFTDALGVAFAIYIDPFLHSYNSGIRVEPPASPTWIPHAGVVPFP